MPIDARSIIAQRGNLMPKAAYRRAAAIRQTRAEARLPQKSIKLIFNKICLFLKKHWTQKPT
jgi:hypothetical protein